MIGLLDRVRYFFRIQYKKKNGDLAVLFYFVISCLKQFSAS